MTFVLRRGVLSAVMLLTLAACQRGGDAEAAAARPAPKQTTEHRVPSELGEMRVTEIVSGLEHPWSVALLPNGEFLVTERPGRLRRVSKDGAISAPIANVPPVWAKGQGGLLDVVDAAISVPPPRADYPFQIFRRSSTLSAMIETI